MGNRRDLGCRWRRNGGAQRLGRSDQPIGIAAYSFALKSLRQSNVGVATTWQSANANRGPSFEG